MSEELVEILFEGIVKVSQAEIDEFGIGQAVQNRIGYAGIMVMSVETETDDE